MGLDTLLKNHGSKLHIHSLSNPGLFSLYGERFAWFSKLLYLGMKLGLWPKFQQWHMYFLSNPGAQNWAHSRSTASGFRDTGRFSKFSYLGMNSRGCTYTLFLPQGVEIERRLRAQLEEKWPQNDLDMLNIKNTHMHTAYTRGLNFHPFHCTMNYF